MVEVLILLGILSAAFLVMNILYKRTNHFKNRKRWFQHLYEVPQNLRIVNLGSSYSYFAFDWEQTAGGYNFAVYPQFVMGDYQVLNNFKGHLNKGAVVLCNFSCMVFGTAAGSWHNQDKYYYFLKRKCIYNYSPWHEIASRWLPLLGNYKLVKYLLKDEPEIQQEEHMQDVCQMTEERVASLCSQFGLKNLTDTEQLPVLAEQIESCKNIIQSVFQMCKEMEFQPVVVITPVCREWYEAMTPEFVEAFLLKPIEEAKENVPILNYWGDEEFMSSEYYFDPIWLNTTGRKRFTERVLSDLKKIGICIPD